MLVHCHQGSQVLYCIDFAGVSRSSSMVICYVMWKNQMHFQMAHEFVKKLRTVASPNSGIFKAAPNRQGFIAQLLRWWKRTQKPKENTRLYEMVTHSSNEPSYVVPKFIEKWIGNSNSTCCIKSLQTIKLTHKIFIIHRLLLIYMLDHRVLLTF